MRLINISGPGVLRERRIDEIKETNPSSSLVVVHDRENRRSIVALEHIPNKPTFESLDDLYKSNILRIPYGDPANPYYVPVYRFCFVEIPNKTNSFALIDRAIINAQNQALTAPDLLAVCDSIAYLSSCLEYDDDLPNMRIELQTITGSGLPSGFCTIYPRIYTDLSVAEIFCIRLEAFLNCNAIAYTKKPPLAQYWPTFEDVDLCKLAHAIACKSAEVPAQRLLTFSPPMTGTTFPLQEQQHRQPAPPPTGYRLNI